MTASALFPCNFKISFSLNGPFFMTNILPEILSSLLVASNVIGSMIGSFVLPKQHDKFNNVIIISVSYLLKYIISLDANCIVVPFFV